MKHTDFQDVARKVLKKQPGHLEKLLAIYVDRNQANVAIFFSVSVKSGVFSDVAVLKVR